MNFALEPRPNGCPHKVRRISIQRLIGIAGREKDGYKWGKITPEIAVVSLILVGPL